MNIDTQAIKEHISILLPNREKVRHFIWDSFSEALPQEFDEYLISEIEEYGTWKERKRTDGILAYKGWIYKQKKQGHWVYYYKNGKLHKDCFYRDNKYHGICIFWNVDGSREVNEYYKGKLNGKRLRYNANGVLFQKWVYEMGHYKEFYSSSELGFHSFQHGAWERENIMKIAIVKLSALGDIVHAMVALQFIKAHYPDAQIDWLVEQGFAEVLRHNPDITNLLTVNLKALKTNKAAIFQQIKQVRGYAKNHYDLVIDAQGLIKSAITAKLLGKKTAGFDKNSARETSAAKFYDVKVPCAYETNTIDRNAFVLSNPLGFAITPEQILNKQPFLFFQNVDPIIYDYLRNDKANIVLVISSTWESRNYPAEKFIKVANALQQNCLVVWGNEAEKQKAEHMASQSAFIQVMPKLDLNSLKALIAKADLLIGNDTGPTHIAWGLNRPSITIFGPTPVSRVYQTDINKVIKSASIVNPYKLNKQDFSIQDIDEQDIIVLANTLIAKKP